LGNYLLDVFGFALACSLALGAVAGTGAVKALASVAGAFTDRALTGSAADVAFDSFFIHSFR